MPWKEEVTDAIGFGKNFDWISPVAAIAQEIAHGGGVPFEIPQSCGWTGNEIQKLLSKNGIPSWGLMAIGQSFTISVPRQHGKAATQLLRRNGLV